MSPCPVRYRHIALRRRQDILQDGLDLRLHCPIGLLFRRGWRGLRGGGFGDVVRVCGLPALRGSRLRLGGLLSRWGGLLSRRWGGLLSRRRGGLLSRWGGLLSRRGGLHGRRGGLFRRWGGLFRRWGGLRWGGLVDRWGGLLRRWGGLVRGDDGSSRSSGGRCRGGVGSRCRNLRHLLSRRRLFGLCLGKLTLRQVARGCCWLLRLLVRRDDVSKEVLHRHHWLVLRDFLHVLHVLAELQTSIGIRGRRGDRPPPPVQKLLGGRGLLSSGSSVRQGPFWDFYGQLQESAILPLAVLQGNLAGPLALDLTQIQHPSCHIRTATHFALVVCQSDQ
mmetsp:Transcript_35268/g.92413  ORF Transcript_35268/g.92413 Transcript_35268/m.92413 type:complete len:333 (-) Transcript_35268:269-1267(-)